MMSGVNVKSVSENGSGIPLPKSLTNLSKTDTKHQSSALLTPAAQNTPFTSSRSSVSPSSVSRGSNLRIQSTYGGINWTPRSANSSPHVPRREVYRFKSTSELRRGSLPQTDFRDLDTRSNRNWTRHRFRSLDDEVTQSSAPGRVHHRSNNGNIIWETSAGVQLSLQKQRMSDRDMMTSKSRVCVTSQRMAAVAPFRLR